MKKKLRKQIQILLDKSNQALQAGNIKLYLMYAEDAHFLSQELEDLKGF